MIIENLYYIGAIITTPIISYGYVYYMKNKLYKQLDKVLKEYKNNELSIDETKNTVIFFDDLLDKKFKFYLGRYFLAKFTAGKEVLPKDIKKAKDEFSIDIEKCLTKHQMDRLLKIYSPKGIELYIHQSFLSKLNNANISFNNNINTEVINEVLKGVN